VEKVKIAITMGDPAGSGPEVAIKALSKLAPSFYESIPILVGDYKVFQRAMQVTNVSNLRLIRITSPEQAIDEPYVINVIDLANVDLEKLVIGKPSALGGKASYESIVVATEYAKNLKVDAIVTAPISKESINMAGYNFPGHTELLAYLTNAKDVRMMLIAKHLRVVHVTTHVSLRRAIELIKKDRILRTIEITDRYLRDYFGVENPKIAVAGLNPHAGEDGLFGDEEIKEIKPAINEAREKGINASGPYPADSVFYRAYYNRDFDCIIAMYHDQGHIPIKMVGFMEGVNITLGLPIIRTSPDHGTVWGKAGKGTADETSMLNAIKIAVEISRQRQMRK